MTLKIDKAGRVILPKPIRDRLGMLPGGQIEIEETQGGLLLTAPSQKPALVKMGSFLVHTGAIPPGYDILNALNDDRNERARKSWGL